MEGGFPQREQNYQNIITMLLSDDDHSMYIFGISIRIWSLVVATPCVLISVCISFVHMLRHCSRNQDKAIRVHILRILFMIPIYAINSLMALVYPFNIEFFTLFRECYESITIYSLAMLLFTYLGGESRLLYLLSLEDQAEDEYHLYRLAQNLANKDVIALPNRNFVQEQFQENTHIATVDGYHNNNNNNNINNDNSTNNYSYNYQLQEFEHKRPFYQRLPCIRSFFPPPEFKVKTTFASVPIHRAAASNSRTTPYNRKSAQLQKQSKQTSRPLRTNPELKSPLLSSPQQQQQSLSSDQYSNTTNNSSTGYGSVQNDYDDDNDNNTNNILHHPQLQSPSQQIPLSINYNNKIMDDENKFSFQTRHSAAPIQASFEEKANYLRYKERRKQQQQSQGTSVSNSSNNFNTLMKTNQIDTNTNDTGSLGLDSNPQGFSGLPVDQQQQQQPNGTPITIATSPPGDRVAQLELDPNQPNHFITPG